MASAKALQDFNSKVVSEITRLGAVNLRPREYTLNTKAGILYITLDSVEGPSKVFTVFSRFSEPQRASNLLLGLGLDEKLNIYSDKWNFHFWSEKECLETFVFCLNKIV